MPITVWRISNEKYADSLFSGIGAEAYGGRFNSPGRPAIYAAGSLSLGILEILVQAGRKERLGRLVYATARFPETLMHTLNPDDLPIGWDTRPAGAASQRVGDAWLKAGESLVLRVPSVVVPGEFNYLINPVHPWFGDIAIGEIRRFELDQRLMP